jgi:hypothetical protein
LRWTIGLQQAAQALEVGLDDVVPARRRAFLPERVDQLGRGHDTTGGRGGGEQTQHRPLLLTPELELITLTPDP